jgi:hypothetical protein
LAIDITITASLLGGCSVIFYSSTTLTSTSLYVFSIMEFILIGSCALALAIICFC